MSHIKLKINQIDWFAAFTTTFDCSECAVAQIDSIAFRALTGDKLQWYAMIHVLVIFLHLHGVNLSFIRFRLISVSWCKITVTFARCQIAHTDTHFSVHLVSLSSLSKFTTAVDGEWEIKEWLIFKHWKLIDNLSLMAARHRKLNWMEQLVPARCAKQQEHWIRNQAINISLAKIPDKESKVKSRVSFGEFYVSLTVMVLLKCCYLN